MMTLSTIPPVVATPTHTVAFSDAFTDVTSGSPKVPSSEYLASGKYPVIDQGAQPVAGFIDDPRLLCTAQLPLILFGDHTRRFKFCEKPFAVGADGVKLLAAHPTLDPRFAFHFLRSISIPNAGYSRHFKFLREIRVPVPPLMDQRRIASILDQAGEVRKAGARAISDLAKLVGSIFSSSFRIPLDAARLGALPPLSQFTEQITDGEHQTPRRSSAGVKLLSARNIRNGHLDLTDVDFVDQAEYERIARRCAPVRGDVLISCSGSVGRVAAVATDEPLVLVRSVALVRPKKSLDPVYLEWFLRSPPIQDAMRRSARSSAQANLFQGPIRALPVLVPPIDDQLRFAESVTQIQRVGRVLERRLVLLDELFASLQYSAFRGEL